MSFKVGVFFVLASASVAFWACSSSTRSGNGIDANGADDAGADGESVVDASPRDSGVRDAGAPDSGTNANGDGGITVTPSFVVPRESLTPSDLALIVNSDDPQSVAVAAYYQMKRGVPAANVIALSLGASFAQNQTQTVDPTTFSGWKAQIDAAAGSAIQAYAVTFTYPSAVNCMSITSALAFGYADAYCGLPGSTCNSTPESPYFDSTSLTPYTTHQMRPAMVVAGTSVANAKALIDQGVAADGTYPLGQGYLMRTSDDARSVRFPDFMDVAQAWNKANSLAFTYIDDSASGTGLVTNEPSVLFYFTGLSSVPMITTNHFLPGAVADHLTSFGGQMPTSSQMSALRWLEAGATASYGTVSEPCALTAKFPQVSVFTNHYFAGETLIEAYWKSVAEPGQGLFIGEPLARPYGTTFSVSNGELKVRTTALVPNKTYLLESSKKPTGPWTPVQGAVSVTYPQVSEISLSGATAPYYRVEAQ